MPLSSICRLPSPIGTGSASEPPWWTRSSSIERSAARAARPTSSGRVFRPSSSSTTIRGITTSTPSNEVTQVGSAIRTDVSSTTLVRNARSSPSIATVDAATSGSRSVTDSPWGSGMLRAR